MPQKPFVIIVVILAALLSPTVSFSADPSGPVVIAGHGPERPTIEELARAFEKVYPAAYVDFVWSKHAKILQMVRSGEADIAVTGKPEPDLAAHQVAWDGIAIMVNVANTTKELTKQNIADIFSGKYKYWSELAGPDYRIRIIKRHPTQNLTHAFEHYLGIVGKIPESAEVIGPEQKATNRVVGVEPPYSAVTYMSLDPALKAVKTGVSVRLLHIDRVEPEVPTVKGGRYTLRRPVLFLTKKTPNATVEAFIAFTRSRRGQRIIDQTYSSLDHLE